MSGRWTVRLAWTLWLVTVGLIIGDAVLSVLGQTASGHRMTLVDWLNVFVYAPALSFSTMGAIVVTHRSGNKIGLLMLATGFGFVSALFSIDYGQYGVVTRPGSLPLAQVAIWITTWIFMPYFLCLCWLLFLFPTGVPASPRWRLFVRFAPLPFAVVAILFAIKPGPVNQVPTDNPLGIWNSPDFLFNTAAIALFACLLGAASCLLLRLRRSRGVERQQLKWFTYAAAIAVILNIAAIASGGWSGPIGGLALGALTLLPVFMGIAILRYRLYEIDVLINQTLVYGVLTISLSLLYIGGVIGLQGLFRIVSGQGSGLAIAISTLTIAALFSPLRTRIRTLIDRRFYRQKYDAAQALAAFNARLRDKVDLDQIRVDMLGIVQDTMQPAHFSLWLRDHDRGT